GNLPDDSTHREEHPLDDEELVADWDGAPESPAAERESAEEHAGPFGADRSGEVDGPDAAEAGTGPSAEDRPVARDVLEEDLIDEREARRVRESEDFTGDFDQDQEELR
ncbi:MAG: cell division ATP-binding protein FtsE, partial [Brachybacterium sp.]